MTKEYTPEEIKYRLSDLGVQIGNIAINYITELEKTCDETQKLLDKQIEATYKLDKENAELKKKLKEELKTIADKDLSFVARFDALGKENAELKEQNTNLQEMLKTERSVTCKEEYLKRVAELEQENAELVQNKYNLEYKIENLENKIEHHQEVIDTFKKKNAELQDKLNNPASVAEVRLANWQKLVKSSRSLAERNQLSKR